MRPTYADLLLAHSLPSDHPPSYLLHAIAPQTVSSYHTPIVSTIPPPSQTRLTHLFVLSLYNTLYPHSLHLIASPPFSNTLVSQSPHR